MRAVWAGVLLGLCCSGWAEASPRVVYADVKVEKRSGRDWCVLDSQVSGDIAVSAQRLLSVIQDYPSYPKLFPRITEAVAVSLPGAVLLSETVVVSAMGITNTNRFTLRIVQETVGSEVVRQVWTQEKTDGTIDSLAGSWTLENLGSSESPRTRVTYTTRSAVPVLAPGQDLLLRMFLGGETKAVLEAVFKKALSR